MKATINKQVTVALSGHRHLSHPQKTITDRLKQTICSLYDQGYRNFITGMAYGFDLLAADVILELRAEKTDIRLIAAIPFAGQELLFSPENQLIYDRVYKSCDIVHYVSQTYSPCVYHQRNDFMVENCSVLLCYCNKCSGGTIYTLSRAVRAEIPVINISD